MPRPMNAMHEFTDLTADIVAYAATSTRDAARQAIGAKAPQILLVELAERYPGVRFATIEMLLLDQLRAAADGGRVEREF